jgi:hypothetical protein
MKTLALINGVPRVVEVTVYDEVVTVPNGGWTAPQNITLPESQTYIASELQVFLDGQRLEANIDYNYVGSAPRTQIQTTFDLLGGERIRFRIEQI